MNNNYDNIDKVKEEIVFLYPELITDVQCFASNDVFDYISVVIEITPSVDNIIKVASNIKDTLIENNLDFYAIELIMFDQLMEQNEFVQVKIPFKSLEQNENDLKKFIINNLKIL